MRDRRRNTANGGHGTCGPEAETGSAHGGQTYHALLRVMPVPHVVATCVPRAGLGPSDRVVARFADWMPSCGLEIAFPQPMARAEALRAIPRLALDALQQGDGSAGHDAGAPDDRGEGARGPAGAPRPVPS